MYAQGLAHIKCSVNSNITIVTVIPINKNYIGFCVKKSGG